MANLGGQVPLLGHIFSEIDQRLEEISLQETGMVLPSMDKIAGQRPLSTVLQPGEESINVVRVRDNITNAGTARYSGIPGTETVIDSVIPCNYLIVTCPIMSQLGALILYVSLGPDIRVKTAPNTFDIPDNADMVITSGSTSNNLAYYDPRIGIRLPRKRHVISYCWGWGELNIGSLVYASFIFQNLREGGD